MAKSFSVLTTAPLSFAMTSFGVPFGAHIACQGEMCRPGAPVSSTVGISGAVAVRLFAITAKMLMRPTRNCGIEVIGSRIAMLSVTDGGFGNVGAVQGM